MKTHTPGPWFEATGWVGAGKQPNPRVICRIDSYPYFETEANLRLIAAAPDLLEACKTALTALIAHDQTAEFDWHEHQIKKLEAAIVKAERGTHEHASKIGSGA